MMIREAIQISIPANSHLDYGDLFTFEQFIKYCDDGCFIDYDGTGRFATADGETDMRIRPSDVTIKPSDLYENGVPGRFRFQTTFSHVMWYNR